ncbi:parallel beta helix pectate lyase-like protein [Terracoccus luteus]|uniref:Parallel beta helix pectate lyase-like protein n=1 Tax=Terracoccus luteus TaxID=53356 RepID=A0A495XV49_9MICO|nr:right-handed parallel beta-helix repeat-containing protein [Terracoccus luteus]RKT78107.1 parallel beta helix pectate lyase-like protein [Terracoccus luteus]
MLRSSASRAVVATVATAVVTLTVGVAPASSAAPSRQAPTRAPSAAARVVEVRPGTGTLQRAVDLARPGDVLALHAGTYRGRVFVAVSGTEAAPIVVRPFGDGAVTVTESFEPADCAATQPNVNRTLMLREGVDWWTFEGLRVVGGVWVSGTNFSAPAAWIKEMTKRKGDWQTRRSLPGRGYVGGRTAVPDPAAAPGVYAALSRTLGVPLDPATGIRLLDNDISGRGIHVALGTRGAITGNTVHDVECGIGPGIWLNTYSDFWDISRNTVSRVADSRWLHYMQEGIRTGSASSYNTVSDNVVTELPTDGRGITTDIDASFNTFSHNTVRGVDIGLNDQESGWGNVWRGNLVVDNRGAGMVFRGADAKLRQPSLNSSTLAAVVVCNVAPTSSLAAGALMSSTFTDNTFRQVSLATNLTSYWGRYGNTWNGRTALPPARPKPAPPGACPPAGARTGAPAPAAG